MSVDQVTEEIRGQLLAGARRRLRRERRRTWIAGVVALLVVIAGLTAVVARSREATQVTTVASKGSAVAFAVCDDYLSIRARMFTLSAIEPSDWELLAQRAAATDDAQLAALVAKLRIVSTESMSPADFEALAALMKHCTDIGSPNYNARYVPIDLGPAPAVDLSRYGELQPFEVGESPLKGSDAPVALGLSPVQVGVTAQGGYVVYWTYAGQPADQGSCLANGSPVSPRLLSCVGGGDVRAAETARPLLTAERATTLHVPAGTSFVVMESGGERYVQRPAAQTVVVVWKTPRNQTPVTAREYDANGTELRCHGAC